MTTKQSWNLAEGDEIVPGLAAVKSLGGGKRFEVFQAVDEHLATLVVVKVLRPDLVADDKSLRVLAREQRLLRRLAHPAIVRSFGGDSEGPRPHLVLEHVEGPTLASLVKRYGPLAREQLVPLVVELCSALSYLAAEQVVHLDIKPANIVMGAPPRLIDFSAARSADKARDLRSRIGTARYLSPEQRDPEAFGGVTAAADVWGLGATLWEAVTAARFEGAVLDDFPEGTHPGVVAAIGACLASDPKERPRPADVVGMLEHAVAALPSKPRLRRGRPRLS